MGQIQRGPHHFKALNANGDKGPWTGGGVDDRHDLAAAADSGLSFSGICIVASSSKEYSATSGKRHRLCRRAKGRDGWLLNVQGSGC